MAGNADGAACRPHCDSPLLAEAGIQVMKNASGDWAASTNGLLSNTQPPRCRWRLYACWPERGRVRDEESYWLRGMRLHIGCVFCIGTQPRFPQIIASENRVAV